MHSCKCRRKWWSIIYQPLKKYQFWKNVDYEWHVVVLSSSRQCRDSIPKEATISYCIALYNSEVVQFLFINSDPLESAILWTANILTKWFPRKRNNFLWELSRRLIIHSLFELTYLSIYKDLFFLFTEKAGSIVQSPKKTLQTHKSLFQIYLSIFTLYTNSLY